MQPTTHDILTDAEEALIAELTDAGMAVEVEPARLAFRRDALVWLEEVEKQRRHPIVQDQETEAAWTVFWTNACRVMAAGVRDEVLARRGAAVARCGEAIRRWRDSLQAAARRSEHAAAFAREMEEATVPRDARGRRVLRRPLDVYFENIGTDGGSVAADE